MTPEKFQLLKDVHRNCSPNTCPLVEWIHALATCQAELAAALQRAEAYRAALEVLASKGCRVVHGGYSEGTTCLNLLERARTGTGRYVEEFRQRYLRKELLCTGCRAADALAAAPPAPAADRNTR